MGEEGQPYRKQHPVRYGGHFLAYPGPKSLLKLEILAINVNKDRFTVIDPTGIPMAVATAWNDLDGYEDWLVRLLLRRR